MVGMERGRNKRVSSSPSNYELLGGSRVGAGFEYRGHSQLCRSSMRSRGLQRVTMKSLVLGQDGPGLQGGLRSDGRQ